MANTLPDTVTRLPRYAGLAVRPVRNGLGIVTVRRIREGALICLIKGKVITPGKVWRYWDSDPQRAENCYRYSAERYLDPHAEIAQYANHSCNPNCGIRKTGGQLALYALRPIARGEELVHDYSTLLGADDTWSMACNCGEINCRKRVRNVSRLPATTFREYTRIGIIPDYILATVPSRA